MSVGHGGETRRRAAAALLSRLGFPGAVVEEGGHDEDVAVIVLPSEDRVRILDADASAIVDGVLALGFRYVTVSLSDGA